MFLRDLVLTIIRFSTLNLRFVSSLICCNMLNVGMHECIINSGDETLGYYEIEGEHYNIMRTIYLVLVVEIIEIL